MKPICFVIMPFGIKTYTRTGTKKESVTINFNTVYEEIIKPAIKDANMDPIRADEEQLRGSIHKPMFERIILSDYVVADLTGANANVFYELGIRHAVKPYTTVSIYEKNSELPFDLKPFRTYSYEFSNDKKLTNSDIVRKIITRDLLESTNNKSTDSPVYQLVDGIKFQNSVAHEKTDIFRDKVRYDNNLRNALALARNHKGDRSAKLAELNKVVNESLLPLHDQEAGVLVDAMLSYRDISEFKEMQSFIEQMPEHIQQTVMVQEQYGFVLNRNGEKDKAIRVLKKVISENGPSSETYGILGRVYKDKFDFAQSEGNQIAAEGYLDLAIDAYRKGFQADWRDAYPGVNLLTLLELQGKSKEVKKLAPVVAYAVERKMETKKTDYWDYATLFEIAVLKNDDKAVFHYLKKAIATEDVRGWMIQSTLKNLSKLFKAKSSRNQDCNKILQYMDILENEARRLDA